MFRNHEVVVTIGLGCERFSFHKFTIEVLIHITEYWSSIKQGTFVFLN